jgi:hypothetical protein
MEPKLDIVIPYRRTHSNELVYALRSLKNFPHGRVFVIGDNPNLPGVIHIAYHQTGDVAHNTHAILTLACNSSIISANFVWMADDMYFMRPIRKIPVLHRGYYDEIIETYKNRRFNFYVQRMIRTNDALKRMGVDNPLCYEVHAPFVINKGKWLALNAPSALNKLSMYGNIYKIGGIKTKDMKVRAKDWVPKGTFASSYDNTFGSNSLGKIIREMFPEECEYER